MGVWLPIKGTFTEQLTMHCAAFPVHVLVNICGAFFRRLKVLDAKYDFEAGLFCSPLKMPSLAYDGRVVSTSGSP